MEGVTDLLQWRASRRPDLDAEARGEAVLERLERAIERLDDLTSVAPRRGRQSERSLETEILASLGAVSADRLAEAAERAERLADRLGTAASAASRR
jgi:hypothetical protein